MRAAIAIVLATALGTVPACGPSSRRAPEGPDSTRRVTDTGRLYEAAALEVAAPTDTAALMALVRRAIRGSLQISIAGRRHSQGGQTFGEGTLQVDMTRFNRVLSLDTVQRVMTVQSGVTWRTVQEAANAHRLAPRVMQNSNVFTVGGSMSVDAHGPDPREGTMIGSVRGFRLLGADGTIRHVDREREPELFRLTIGGYGLFGIILDADVALTGNAVYRRRTRIMPVDEYPAWFAREVRGDSTVGIHYAWLSIAPGSLLREAYAMTYVEVEPRADSAASMASRPDRLTRFFFSLSRRWDWGKTLRWNLQKWLGQPGVPELCTRNDVLSPNIEFLEHRDEATTDILQEYFVPAGRLVPFLEDMARVVRSHRVNLLSATVRFLPEAERPFLSYARGGDAFGVVIYANVRRDEAGRAAAAAWTRELVEAALNQEGTYYLVYQLLPTAEQLRRAYPEFDTFVELKRKHDPHGTFSSTFYRHYSEVRASR